MWRSTRLGIPTTPAYPHAADGWSLAAASDAVGAALGVFEFGDFGDVVGGDGDGDELGDVVAGGDVLGLVAGVVEADFDGAAIPAIYDAGAVAEHQVFLDTGAAAHEHHADIAAWYGNVNAGVPYPVGTNGHGEVVFEGEVYPGIVFVGLARVGGTLVEGVVNQCGFLSGSMSTGASAGRVKLPSRVEPNTVSPSWAA